MNKLMPVWLFRCNYIDMGNKWPQYENVSTFYEQNRCPITILASETWDKYCYNAFLEGKNNKDISWDVYSKSHPNERKATVPMYLNRFFTLTNKASNQDVLVILEFKDNGKGKKPNIKIGILRKATEIKVFKGNNYEIFYLELDPESVVVMPKGRYSILNSLIPSNVTLGPVMSRENAINELYYHVKDGSIIRKQLDNLPNDKIEDLCTMWLQSKFAGKYKFREVYVKNGRLNFPFLDILGKTENNELLAAQVSFTNDKGIILSKIDKLKRAIENVTYILFTRLSKQDFDSLCNKKSIQDVNHVSLGQVWDDLYNDPALKGKVEKFFMDSY